jgi:hypothetical protein
MRSQLENVIKKRENTCAKWHYAFFASDALTFSTEHDMIIKNNV